MPLLMKIAFLRSVADRLLNVACAMLKNRTLFNLLVRVEESTLKTTRPGAF